MKLHPMALAYVDKVSTELVGVHAFLFVLDKTKFGMVPLVYVLQDSSEHPTDSVLDK
jgi:hypothetical protein